MTISNLILAALLFSQISLAINKNDDVKVVSSKAQFITFLPLTEGIKLTKNPYNNGLVLNTLYCQELSSTSYGDSAQSKAMTYDCNYAFSNAFEKPLLNQSEPTEVHQFNNQVYSRKLGYVYEIKALVKKTAFDAESFKGIGIHAHNVRFWESTYNKHWGELVGSNDAQGGFLPKSLIDQSKKEVTLKNGEKAYLFDFILAHVHLVNGSSKPEYTGISFRPNALYTANGIDYVQWDNTEFDYYTGHDFDRSPELF
jgi:hypothetical protein